MAENAVQERTEAPAAPAAPAIDSGLMGLALTRNLSSAEMLAWGWRSYQGRRLDGVGLVLLGYIGFV